MLRGVRQGCPASGVLFALCCDPLFRWLAVKVVGPRGSLRAFADDLAFVTRSLDLILARLGVAFCVIAGAAGLALKPAMCVVVPLGNTGGEAVRALLADLAPGFVGFAVRRAALYLGAVLGPDAELTR